jgi:YVTN family beta-propeller protein
VAQALDLGAGAYPKGVALANDAVWVGNSGTSTVTRVDATTVSIVQSAIALRAVPDAIAAGPDAVWIAGREDDVVLRIDPGSNSVSKTINVGDQPVSLAIDGQTLWVGCAGAEEAVWQIDVDGTVKAKIDVGGVPTDIAVGDGRIYVTVRQQ